MSKLHIYNTLTRNVQEFVPRVPGEVGIYVCGMTVYDLCHIGHARAMMAFDIVVRYLRNRGYKVTYVRNHTDVDDKIIARARKDNLSGLAVSSRYIEELDKDLDSLGILRPDIEPRVSTSIPEIIGIIAKLFEHGHAYQGPSGDIYFSVESFSGYGKLSGKKVEDLQAGHRVEVDAEKRHPADFVLWKAVSGPATLDGPEPCWDSPWGVGRPGWHIECSGMSYLHLGEQFDLHGGGIDLIFPHHENEIAQSEGATQKSPMVGCWMHNGHLSLRDENGPVKMSKSLGNVLNIRDMLQKLPAEALRLAYIEVHYRSPLIWTEELIPSTLTALDRLYQAKETALDILKTASSTPVSALGPDAAEAYELGMRFPGRFQEAMDEDFNTAAALGALFELVRAVNRFGNDKKKRKQGRLVIEPAVAAFKLVGEVLGIGAMEPAAFFEELKYKHLAHTGRSVAEIDAKVQARHQAREVKDWGLADQLRVELEGEGVVVMDGVEGSTWRVRVGN
jgi:cysteinyl-tRNA synthetase